MTIFIPENNDRGISQAEAILKAIATESFLQQEIKNGSKILIETDRSLKEVVFR